MLRVGEAAREVGGTPACQDPRREREDDAATSVALSSRLPLLRPALLAPGLHGFALLRRPHDRLRHPEVAATEWPVADGAEAAFRRREWTPALGADEGDDGALHGEGPSTGRVLPQGG